MRELPAKCRLTIRRGDVFRHVLGGAGGWGNPAERDPARVAQDVAEDKLSAETRAASTVWRSIQLPGSCSARSIRRQPDLNLGPLFLKGKKYRGVAIGPAAGGCVGHLLLANRRETHRRIGCPREFKRQTEILARQRQREAQVEIAAQPGSGKAYLEAHHLTERSLVEDVDDGTTARASRSTS
jgi:hypothetical protein